MRIVAGDWKGRRIAAAAGSRPTSEKVREALLAIWQSCVPGARFLDLFCGGGAVGLEAASRGAERVTFVDRDRRSIDTVSANCRALGLRDFSVRRAELPRGLRALERDGEGAYELIFADPPYDFSGHVTLVAAAAPLLAAGGSLALEHAADVDLGDDFGDLVLVDERRYGSSSISFFRHPSTAAETRSPRERSADRRSSP